jgi:hypothetical protein
MILSKHHHHHIGVNKPLIDFPSWMVKLTIDFISTTMFDGDFEAIGGKFIYEYIHIYTCI